MPQFIAPASTHRTLGLSLENASELGLLRATKGAKAQERVTWTGWFSTPML